MTWLKKITARYRAWEAGQAQSAREIDERHASILRGSAVRVDPAEARAILAHADRLDPPPQVIPRFLGPLGKITSEATAIVLQTIASVQGKDVADDIAAGYVDGAARYWSDEDDRATAHKQAAE